MQRASFVYWQGYWVGLRLILVQRLKDADKLVCQKLTGLLDAQMTLPRYVAHWCQVLCDVAIGREL
jgi:hypothetical protein